MLFFGLIALADGPQGNDEVAGELALRIQDTIRYHHQVLVGHNVSLTNDDFFEQCLQKINSEINVFLRDVHVALPVHRWAMTVGMLTEDTDQHWQVFLSRFGEVNAWLLHKAQLDTYKLISIFDAPDPITGSPGAQKYFKNIVSSSLSAQDQLLFCTPNVFNYISLSDMKRILVELSAKASMKHLQNILQEHLQDPLAAAMTLKLSFYKQTGPVTPPASQSNEAEQSMNELMATQSQTERILGTSVGLSMNQVKQAAKRLVEGGKPLASSASGAPTVGIRAPKAKASQNPAMQALTIVSASLRKAFAATGAAVQRWRDRRMNNSPMGKSQYVAVHGSVAKVSQWRSTLTRWLQPLLGAARRKGGQADWRGLIRSPRIYAVLVVVIIAAVIGQKVYANKKAYQQTVTNAQTDLQSVKAALDRIDSYLIVGRETDAVILTQQAKETLALVKDDLTQFHDQKAAYAAKIDEQQRRLRKEIPISAPTAVLEDLQSRLNSEAKFLVRNGDSVAIVGQDPHTMIDFNLKNSTPTSRSIATDLTKVDAVSRNENNVYVLSGNTIASIALNKGTSSPGATVSAKNPLVAIQIYNSRVYAVSPADNQIQRSNGLPNFSVFSPWLKDPSPDLANGVDIAIDGSIFVLTKTGLVQFTQGTRVNSFKLDAVEPAMKAASALSYDADNKNFFVLEGNRLLVFKKTGKFVAQYIVNTAQPITDILVDEQNTMAFALTADTLYSFPVQLSQ